MKTKFVSKIFLLFIFMCAFAAANIAQEKPQAILIGEFEPENGISAFERMTEQLIFRLSQEPSTTRGLIDVSEKSDLSEKVKTILLKHPKLKNNILYGFSEEVLRPTFRATFWLIPLNAEMPDLGCRTPVCMCPTLRVDGIKLIDKMVDYLTFSASAEGGRGETVTYKWNVSAGKIIEGQGTAIIKVDAEAAKEVTATLEIDGLRCEECQREASFTTKIQAN